MKQGQSRAQKATQAAARWAGTARIAHSAQKTRQKPGGSRHIHPEMGGQKNGNHMREGRSMRCKVAEPRHQFAAGALKGKQKAFPRGAGR